MEVPKAIKLPGAPEIFTTIDGNGKHYIQCDLCGLSIPLTASAHPRSFLQHRRGYACLKLEIVTSYLLPVKPGTCRPFYHK
jgi:hypothetical protein